MLLRTYVPIGVWLAGCIRGALYLEIEIGAGCMVETVSRYIRFLLTMRQKHQYSGENMDEYYSGCYTQSWQHIVRQTGCI